MNKEQLQKEIDSIEKKAERNYRNYQETGISRYYNEYRKADDLAWALRMALNAHDEHNQLLGMNTSVHTWASTIQRLKWMSPDKAEAETKQLLKDIESYAVLSGLIKKEE